MHIGRVLAVFGAAGVIAAPVTSANASAVAEAPRPADSAAMAAVDCPAGYVCLWEGVSFTGRRIVVTKPITPGSCKMSGTYRSIWNRSGSTQRAWANLICTQNALTIGSGTAYENVGGRHSLGGYP